MDDNNLTKSKSNLEILAMSSQITLQLGLFFFKVSQASLSNSINPIVNKNVITYTLNDEYNLDLEKYANQPEGTTRCFICYEKRMNEAFKYAYENGFDFFELLSDGPHNALNLLSHPELIKPLKDCDLEICIHGPNIDLNLASLNSRIRELSKQFFLIQVNKFDDSKMSEIQNKWSDFKKAIDNLSKDE